ncbi:protein chibby homolog 1-like [Megalops cyprinoides]|uniref:protein chibby homolog 1-like n=1 Tax=Megalops cyprinoides TaxID=118141 RepID=UPI0018641234|nr:protein chibby homolog 1-like [Megalops cyprinoides]
MSILRDIWDTLGNPSPYRGTGFRIVPRLHVPSLSPRYILDYNSRMAELGLDGPPTLSLAGHSFTFLEGRWVCSATEDRPRQRARLQRLKQQQQVLQAENEALKLRLQVLMDLLTETMMQRGAGADATPHGKKATLVTQ